MVLIYILSLLFAVTEPLEGPLLSKYLKSSHKVLTKHFGAEIQDIKRIKHASVEKYHVSVNDKKVHLVLAEVAACKLGGCSIFVGDSDDLSSEYFDLLLVLSAEDIIQEIKILDYFSDYGYEINSKRYLKKFIGKSPCDFKLQTDDIDGISGATISSSALESIISQLCE